MLLNAHTRLDGLTMPVSVHPLYMPAIVAHPRPLQAAYSRPLQACDFRVLRPRKSWLVRRFQAL